MCYHFRPDGCHTLGHCSSSGIMSRRFSIDENSFFGNITVGQVLRTSSKETENWALELKNKAAGVLQCLVLCQRGPWTSYPGQMWGIWRRKVFPQTRERSSDRPKAIQWDGGFPCSETRSELVLDFWGHLAGFGLLVMLPLHMALNQFVSYTC